ncbi:unnamed protein product, partial [Discosporangium mesarthrocarpum]
LTLCSWFSKFVVVALIALSRSEDALAIHRHMGIVMDGSRGEYSDGVAASFLFNGSLLADPSAGPSWRDNRYPPWKTKTSTGETERRGKELEEWDDQGGGGDKKDIAEGKKGSNFGWGLRQHQASERKSALPCVGSTGSPSSTGECRSRSDRSLGSRDSEDKETAIIYNRVEDLLARPSPDLDRISLVRVGGQKNATVLEDSSGELPKLLTARGGVTKVRSKDRSDRRRGEVQRPEQPERKERKSESRKDSGGTGAHASGIGAGRGRGIDLSLLAEAFAYAERVGKADEECGHGSKENYSWSSR